MKENIIICSYSSFPKLGHQPHGNENITPLKICNNFLSKFVHIDNCYNPAFAIKHPVENIIYLCCESIFEGHLLTVKYDSMYNFTLLKKVETGRSACYLEFDFEIQNLIVVNYWDSTIKIHPLINNIAENSVFTVKSKYVYNNRPNHLKNRQKESHNHSILFYRFQKKVIAFVPDFGKDLIKIFNYDIYNKTCLKLIKCCKLPKKSGPRYLCNLNNFLYVVNELNSTIQILKIKKNIIGNIFLSNKQIISTIPNNYKGHNICGNIAIHPSKKYLFVSNRGHNSISFYRIEKNYQLNLIDIINSNGYVPRHFIINKDGNLIYVANQDSDNISCFNFRNESMIFSHQINVNSPNFLLEI